jgi:hypothetical protein
MTAAADIAHIGALLVEYPRGLGLAAPTDNAATITGTIAICSQTAARAVEPWA